MDAALAGLIGAGIGGSCAVLAQFVSQWRAASRERLASLRSGYADLGAALTRFVCEQTTSEFWFGELAKVTDALEAALKTNDDRAIRGVQELLAHVKGRQVDNRAAFDKALNDIESFRCHLMMLETDAHAIVRMNALCEKVGLCQSREAALNLESQVASWLSAEAIRLGLGRTRSFRRLQRSTKADIPPRAADGVQEACDHDAPAGGL